MKDNVMNMNELTDDEILTLYDSIVNHLKYLQEHIIDTSTEGGELSNE